MSGKMFFEIPRSQNARLEIIRKFPVWNHVRGILFAPLHHIGRNDTALGVGYVFGATNPPVSLKSEADIGLVDPYENPDFESRIIGSKLPSFLSFDGIEEKKGAAITFEFCRKCIISYLIRGYGGGKRGGMISFFRYTSYAPTTLNYATRCTIQFNPQTRETLTGEQCLSRLELAWNESCGGTREGIQPIIDLCIAHRCVEYIPQPPAGVHADHQVTV